MTGRQWQEIRYLWERRKEAPPICNGSGDFLWLTGGIEIATIY